VERRCTDLMYPTYSLVMPWLLLMGFDFIQSSMVVLNGEVEPITFCDPRLPDASFFVIEFDI